MKIKRLLLNLLLFIVSTVFLYPQTSEEIIIPNRENASEHQEKPYVILISIDGFRNDYIEKFDLPFFKEMQTKAVIAKSLIPSYPSITFPNHYTLVTGLYPSHHGVVGNRMYNPQKNTYFNMRDRDAVTDAEWYGGIPIWSLSEQQKMLTACYYWPGSEAPIADHYPTYYFPYSESTGVEERIEKIVDWLQLPSEKRPHLITFYMPQVDQAGHRFGPEAMETAFAARYVDASLAKLVQRLSKIDLPIHYVLLSDHGMTALNRKERIPLPKVDQEIAEILNLGTYASLFIKDNRKTDSLYQAYRQKIKPSDPYQVYRKAEIPEKYNFSAKDDLHHRIGDLVFIAEAPYYLTTTQYPLPAGAHGYHPADSPDMETMFFAWGPSIQEAKTIESFENIHIFPLLTELLGLKYHHPIDGDQRLIPLLLQP